MDDQFSVWIKMFEGWKLIGHMSRDVAIRTHNEYTANGVKCRLHPRLRVTQQMMAEG